MTDEWYGEEMWFCRKMWKYATWADGTTPHYKNNMDRVRQEIDKMLKADKEGIIQLLKAPPGFDFAMNGVSGIGTKFTKEWSIRLSAYRTTFHYDDGDRYWWSCCKTQTQNHPLPHFKTKFE